MQQQVPAPPVQPFCGAWLTALVHPSTLQAVPVVHVVVNDQPEVLPFSNPPLVTTFPEHVGLHMTGVGVPVRVTVPEFVYVMLIVRVCEIVLVFQGVHVRDKVGGHVMVGVGLCGTTQQIVISIRSRHS